MEREQPQDSLGGGAFSAEGMAVQRPWGRPAPGISRHGQEGRRAREEGERGRARGNQSSEERLSRAGPQVTVRTWLLL